MEFTGPDHRPTRGRRTQRAGRKDLLSASTPVHARKISQTSFLSLSDSSTESLPLSDSDREPPSGGQAKASTSQPLGSLARNVSTERLLTSAVPFSGNSARSASFSRPFSPSRPPPPTSPSLGSSSSSSSWLKPPPAVDPHLSRYFAPQNQRDTTLDIIDDYLRPRTPVGSRGNSVVSRLSVEFAPETVGFSGAYRPVAPPPRLFSPRKRARNFEAGALSPIESVSGGSASPTTPRPPPTPAVPSTPVIAERPEEDEVNAAPGPSVDAKVTPEALVEAPAAAAAPSSDVTASGANIVSAPDTKGDVEAEADTEADVSSGAIPARGRGGWRGRGGRGGGGRGGRGRGGLVGAGAAAGVGAAEATATAEDTTDGEADAGAGGFRGRGGMRGRGRGRGGRGGRGRGGARGGAFAAGGDQEKPDGEPENEKEKPEEGEAKAKKAGPIPPGPMNDPAKRKAAKKAQRFQTTRDFFKIFSHTTKRDRFFIAASVFGAVGAGLTYPAQTIVFGNLIGNLTSSSYAGLSLEDIKAHMTGIIDQSVLYMVYIFAVRLVCGYVATLGFNVMSIRVSSSIRLAYLKALLGQRVSMLDTQPPGQLAAIITSTANTMQAGISEKFALLVQSAALIIGAMCNAFYHNWKLTLITSSGLLLIIICYCITTPFVVKHQKQVEQTNMKASGAASEAFGAMRMVAACGAEAKMLTKYEAWVSKSRQSGMRLSTIVGIQKAIVFFSVIGTFALSCWYAARMIVDHEIPNNSILIIVLMSVMMTINTIGNIAQPISAVSRAAHAARILFNGIEAPKPKTTGKKAPEVSAAERVVLWNVNFTYPSRPKAKILDQLKLIIPAGKVTAIVGPSGSGKSTIVSLIMRWYELDGAANGNKLVQYFRNGNIRCGGVPLHEIDLKWWRSQIGLVQQEPFLFNDTIFRNVSHGLIGTEWEDADEEKKRELVKRACEEAFADEFISRLPDGYDTPVGDSGGKLSGGQRQRLAIARAIVKQPRILVLDEATSAIDVRGEKVVQAALEKVSQGRTTIIVAHRLSTVKNADNIVVMSKGKVAQTGRHAQLIAKKDGPYWLLTQAQQLTTGEDKHDSQDESSDTAVSDDEKRTMDLMDKSEKKRHSQVPDDKAKEDTKAKGLLKSFGPLMMEQKKHWVWYCFMFFGAVMAAASAPLQAFLFASLLSSFNLSRQYLLMLTNFWCLMFAVLAGCVGFGYFALTFASTRIAFIITTSYQLDYFTNMISKPVSWFDKEESNGGSLTNRLASDSTALQQLLGNSLAFILIAILSISGCMGLAFYFGWKLTAIALSCAMPLAIAAGFFRSRVEKKFQKMNSKVFAESAKFATESMSAIRTVTALTLEDTISKKYEKMLDDHLHMAYKKARVGTILFSASDAVPLLCIAFILWYGGGLLVNGEYTSLQYLVVYLSVVQGAQGVGQWLSFVPNISNARVAAQRIQEVRIKEIDPNKGIKMNDPTLKLDFKDETMGPRIELQDVWFKYPTRDVPVLCGLDMTIEKGQFAAIVGPSGCGKTSVISILERFYEIQSGSVHMNGVDIENIQIGEYRKIMSLVAQEPFMFQGTIRENILFGVDPDRICCDHELYQACRDAEIHEFIMSLPEGYNTRVGFKGILLSGGQKQRMSIARALIRNPRLLLLDEATSALDSETEKLVQGVFEKTKQSRTMVVVAHRLATIQNADVIFVLGEGSVVESGTHAQLLAKKGVYWSMCQAQSLE